MKFRKLLICILAVALAIAAVPGSTGGTGALPVQASDLEEEIDQLEAEQAELEEQIEELRSQHSDSLTKVEEILAQKDLIDQEIFLLNEQLELLDRQMISTSALIAQTTLELEQAEAELKQAQDANAQRIRAMEKNSNQNTYWAVIFQAEDFIDLLDSLKMYADIQATDNAMIEELAAAAQTVEDKQTQLQTQRDELEQNQKELTQTQQTLEARAQEADELLAQAVAEETRFRELLEESEAKQDALAQQIAQAQKQHESIVKPPAGGDSGWMVPCSYVYVSSPFGIRIHPISGVEKMHYGIDLAAYQGTPIYATRSGTVTVAAYEEGGAGYYVYINHGDGYGSIYMHMTHYIVSYGQYVNQGDVIGYVGSTGGSTGPHLHFGISKNGVYVDPADYISV